MKRARNPRMFVAGELAPEGRRLNRFPPSASSARMRRSEQTEVCQHMSCATSFGTLTAFDFILHILLSHLALAIKRLPVPAKSCSSRSHYKLFSRSSRQAITMLMTQVFLTACMRDDWVKSRSQKPHPELDKRVISDSDESRAMHLGIDCLRMPPTLGMSDARAAAQHIESTFRKTGRLNRQSWSARTVLLFESTCESA